MSNQWDWWKHTGDGVRTEASWQPLTAEEQAKVILLPPSQSKKSKKPSAPQAVVDPVEPPTVESSVASEPAQNRRPWLPQYTHEDVLAALDEMTKFYDDRIPSLTQVKQYRGNIQGCRRMRR